MQWRTHLIDKTLGDVPHGAYGFVKRRARTKTKVSVFDFKAQFVFEVKAIIEMEESPGELAINWDQIGIHYISVSSWMMAKKSSK